MLADILGQDQIADKFRNAWKQQRLAQAYILAGPDAIGKTPFALELAKTFLCREHGDDACDRCPSCRKVAHGNHQDVEVLEPAGAGRIISNDTVQGLIESLRFKARSGEHRFVIIREADRIPERGANHFLKMLEEPPTDVTFFLLTARMPVLLATIVSRCQIVRMHRAEPEDIQRFLTDRGCEPEKARLCASLCDGCPGRAVNMVQKGEVFERRAQVLKRLLVLDRDNMDVVAAETLAANKEKTLAATRANHYADLGLMATLLRDTTLIAEGAGRSMLYHSDVADSLRPRAEASSPGRLREQTLCVLEARENIELFVNPDLLISRLFLELCT
ncbi:MAG: hypothetical protein HQ592_03635 [Planctomycetes bacterium]|nr:hypothetical protein [Planctomycetota bacterium]